MDAIGDILLGRRSEEPDEVRIIKKFVHDKYSVTPQVSIHTDQIVISVCALDLTRP